MKKLIVLLVVTAGVVLAQGDRSTFRKEVSGTNTYLGYAKVTVGATPADTQQVWFVSKQVDLGGGASQYLQCYGLTNGVAYSEVVKWSDRASTNVVYK